MSKGSPFSQTERAALAGGRLLRYVDLAGYLGLSLRTCKRWVAEGVLPSPDLRLRGIVRWRPATIEGWLTKQGKTRN